MYSRENYFNLKNTHKLKMIFKMKNYSNNKLLNKYFYMKKIRL